MMWNWQKPDWPDFSWDQTLLRKAEEHFKLSSLAAFSPPAATAKSLILSL